MHTNLCKVGGKWAVEVIGGSDEETFVKTFSGREHATNWVRAMNLDHSKIPALKKKGAAKSKKVASKPKAESKKK